MKIVTVIPLAKGIFKQDLTYFTAKDVTLGNIVTVLVRNRKILALVVSVEPVSAGKSNIKELDFSLRKILDVKDKSIFFHEYIESTLSLAKYFHSAGYKVSFETPFQNMTSSTTKDVDLSVTDKLGNTIHFEIYMPVHAIEVEGFFAPRSLFK